METKEKTKLYPSQINTKTISCRISANDYVSFLQDAISKGISLNDWLLIKIYSKSLGKVAQIEEEEPLKEEEYEFSHPDYTFPLEFSSQWGELTFQDQYEIIEFIEDCHQKLSEAMKLYQDYRLKFERLNQINSKIVNAEDLKSNTLLRMSIFNSLREVAREIEWESPADKKAVLKDIFTLYKDLFGE
jgi:hypothetical protein